MAVAAGCVLETSDGLPGGQGRGAFAGVALGAVLSLAVTSHAAVLSTAPARADHPSSGRTLYCDIRNLNAGNGIVPIEILGYSGNVLRTSVP